jgi:proline utilization trans-activator
MEPGSPEARSSRPSVVEEPRTQSQVPPADCEISNPYHEPRNLFHVDQTQRQQFIGESTCLAFSDRMLQYLSPNSAPSSMSPEHQYIQNRMFERQLSDISSCKIPERIRATLLIRVALRFIGHDYHFFLHHDFLQQLDRAYSSKDSQLWNSNWACKFFVVLALGELYSTSMPTASHGKGPAVPGTDYFLTAVSLLQDLFEQPSISQVEVMLLFVSLFQPIS